MAGSHQHGAILAPAAIAAALARAANPDELPRRVGDLYQRIGSAFSVPMAEAIFDAIDSQSRGAPKEAREKLLGWAGDAARTGAPTPAWVHARLLGTRSGSVAAWDATLAAAPELVPAGLIERSRARLRAGDVPGAAADLRLALQQACDHALWSRAEKVGRRLAGQEGVPFARTLRLAVLGGTGSLALLVPLLRLACLRDGIDLTLFEGEYDGWQQEILDPSGPLAAFRPEVALLATHWRDAGLPAFCDDPEPAVDEAVSRTAQLWHTLRERFDCTVVAQTFDAPAPDAYGRLGVALPGGRAAMLRRLNARLRELAGPGVVLLDLESVAGSVGPGWSAPRHWYASRQHPGPQGLVPLVEAQAAHLRAVLGLARKVLITDLDNTLWGGVVGEDGVDGIVLGPPSASGEAFKDLQTHLKQLRQRGVLLAVCSKNNEPDAREVFERHGECVLQLDDFVVFCANWDDKVSNLRAIAEKLSLGLDSFVFVDDNPVERAWVREQLPEVAVPELPGDPSEHVSELARGRWFEVLELSEEDRQRHASYRADVDRRELEGAAGSLEEFLERLAMRARHGPFDAATLGRVTQLVNKTNQFNLATRRYTQQQLHAQADDPAWWTRWFRLEDRFKDTGLIGVLTCRRDDAGGTWTIDNWLMSCRVLGRRFEIYMLKVAIDAAREAGARRMLGSYAPTAKNAQVADLLPKLGFSLVSGEAGAESSWSLDLADADLPSVPITTTD